MSERIIDHKHPPPPAARFTHVLEFEESEDVPNTKDLRYLIDEAEGITGATLVQADFEYLFPAKQSLLRVKDEGEDS